MNCFRPLAGIWFWNNECSIGVFDCRWGFRPLAGIWFWNNAQLFQVLFSFLMVSVPLRGYGFEIWHAAVVSCRSEIKFPSPCGDMVLKFHFNDVKGCFFCCFRPLAGIWFWNGGWFREDFQNGTLVSVPLRGYGFEIMKFAVKNIKNAVCFRPLTGIWFWNLRKRSRSKCTTITVSVPLRGYGFEIYGYVREMTHDNKGFRPLTGIWFWNG